MDDHRMLRLQNSCEVEEGFVFVRLHVYNPNDVKRNPLFSGGPTEFSCPILLLSKGNWRSWQGLPNLSFTSQWSQSSGSLERWVGRTIIRSAYLQRIPSWRIEKPSPSVLNCCQECQMGVIVNCQRFFTRGSYYKASVFYGT